MLEKMKQLYELQKKAQHVQKELAKITIESETGLGMVKMSMTGDQKVLSVYVAPGLLSPEQKKTLESYLKDCFQQALTRLQQASMSKISDMAGGMNIPGLFG